MLDFLAAVRELEGGLCLLCILLAGRYCGQDGGQGVAPDGVAEDHGQLGVPVGDEGLAAGQTLHHRDQGEQRAVDGARLLQPLALCLAVLQLELATNLREDFTITERRTLLRL